MAYGKWGEKERKNIPADKLRKLREKIEKKSESKIPRVTNTYENTNPNSTPKKFWKFW